MKKGSTVYKQFFKYVPLDEMDRLQWFALKPNYGSSYGDIHKTYTFKKKPKLLDIGDADVRVMIKETICKDADSCVAITRLSNPNEQYSGDKANKEYHILVQKFFGDDYHGTVIDQDNLQGNEVYEKEDLEGPDEIVLWKDHAALLETRAASPRAASPKAASPRAASPRSASSRAASPRSASSRSASPRAASPRAKKKRKTKKSNSKSP